ncbi:MAG: lytic transglycosylase domain-containing protein [Bacteriovorax sp.]|nr:lytic transglycosylase domain-containing protein [Bacteriovorax sp.]
MLRLVTLAIFTTCYLSAALATPNLNFATIALAEEAPFHLNYSPMDLDYGKDIELLFGELSKNVLKKKTVDSLARYQQKTHSFSILNSTYERLKLLLAIEDQDSFYKNCTIISKNVNAYTDNIADRINISIDKHCRYLFLKRLTALSSNINFSSRDLAYFKDAAPFYSTGESQPDLVLFLRHYKTNTTEHEKLSNVMIEKFIEFKIKPASSVLTSLRVNPQFNKFLQNNLNLDDTSNSYFQEEFQRLSHDAQEAAEKGDNQQAKLMINSAVIFYNHNKNFINTHKAWVGTILTGKALFYKGRDADAIEIFNLAKSISTKEDSSESFFYLIWPHLINKDYKAMKAVVDKNGLEKNFDKFDSKLQYWIAYAFLKTGDVKKGTAFFNKIINTSPYSFYSIISLKELATLNKGVLSEAEILSKLVSRDEPVEYSLDKTSNNLKDSLKRLAVWNKIGNERFATLELRYVQSLSKEDTFKEPEFAKSVTPLAHKEFLIMNLIRLLNTQKRYITSFKVFQDSLEQNSLSLNYKLIKFIFPLNYIDLIKKNAESLDPLIVISLIRQESAFNPEAKSGVGAKGLMQLMPATAKRFNKKVRVSHLGNPEINVAIGSRYLRQLLARFDGNLIFALASYNAGENRIDRWRKEIFRNDDPLSTIESIPFEETRNYVKLIYRNNFFYSLLSNKPVLMIPLEETFKVSLGPKNF